MAVNYRQIKAIEKKNKERILEIAPNIPDTSGIYVFVRYENNFKYAYVGQAKHLWTRVAQHLSGYQHIDLSIKKYGLFSNINPNGWNVRWKSVPEDKLNEAEQKYILEFANKGYQLRNKTSGSQGVGKYGIDDNKAPKGYYDGLKQGYKNAQRDVAKLFDKHLTFSKRSDKPNKLQERALEKFKEFLNGSENL